MDSYLPVPVLATLATGLLSATIYFFLSRPKLFGDGENLPKKMKRLVVLETPEDYKGFEDLKDFKVLLFKCQ